MAIKVSIVCAIAYVLIIISQEALSHMIFVALLQSSPSRRRAVADGCASKARSLRAVQLADRSIGKQSARCLCDVLALRLKALSRTLCVVLLQWNPSCRRTC
jgi:hypothetical protein